MTASPIAAAQSAALEGTGQSERDSSRSVAVCESSTLGSPYIPVDSWVYPAVLRLYSLGYVDHVYLGPPFARSIDLSGGQPAEDKKDPGSGLAGDGMSRPG